MESENTTKSVVACQPRQVNAKRSPNQIPDEILYDPVLNADLEHLPPAYRFEVHKCIWQIKRQQARRVALQFPEGLTMFACLLASIMQKHSSCQPVIMTDVTYGACCVDDYTAKQLGCDMLIHYGHSCLVPITQTTIPCVYVFVEIAIDVGHLIDILKENFKPGTRFALVSTIQFIQAIHELKRNPAGLPFEFTIPQAKPLSPGELLGCTAPRINEPLDHMLYVGDGRFHLEAAMIANPQIPSFLRYDPYARCMTSEGYDQPRMLQNRRSAINQARSAKSFGLILGTLGRQGTPAIFHELKSRLRKAGLHFIPFLMTEVRPANLARFPFIDAWIQVACPRLSIDWGTAEFEKPLLTPYEACVMLEQAEWLAPNYPMDYYARDSLGPWTVYKNKI